MTVNIYTLDRFEGEYGIFLKRSEEVEQLLIARIDLDSSLAEGDVVSIEDTGLSYNVQKLVEETEDAKQRVSSLLQKLQQKK